MSATALGFELVPLCLHREYIPECIKVLNQEWPRSYAARENSINRCLNETPDMSVVLLTKTNPKIVIGHARLCRLPTDPNACWVESVIVREDHRGKGIGKLLMESIEIKSKAFGYKKIFLSTEDKYEFYKRCGYTDCPDVLNAGAGSSLMSKFSIKKFLSGPCEPSVKNASTNNCEGITKNNASAPPPPAPPPPLGKKKNNTQKTKQYLSKTL